MIENKLVWIWISATGAIIAGLLSWYVRRFRRQILSIRQQRMSSRAVLKYLITESKWGQEGNANMAFLDAIGEFERAARDGEIEVVGRPRYTLRYESIRPDYWRSARLEMSSHIMKNTSPRTEPKLLSRELVIYKDILVDRAQVERLWPKSLDTLPDGQSKSAAQLQPVGTLPEQV